LEEVSERGRFIPKVQALGNGRFALGEYGICGFLVCVFERFGLLPTLAILGWQVVNNSEALVSEWFERGGSATLDTESATISG
jgi:hypothetical protein